MSVATNLAASTTKSGLRQKSAVVISDRKILFDRKKPGTTITAKWKIQNQAKKAWPYAVMLMDFSKVKRGKGKLLQEPIAIDKVLAVNEEFEVSATLKVPEDATDQFIEGKFRLWDPTR